MWLKSKEATFHVLESWTIIINSFKSTKGIKFSVADHQLRTSRNKINKCKNTDVTINSKLWLGSGHLWKRKCEKLHREGVPFSPYLLNDAKILNQFHVLISIFCLTQGKEEAETIFSSLISFWLRFIQTLWLYLAGIILSFKF